MIKSYKIVALGLILASSTALAQEPQTTQTRLLIRAALEELVTSPIRFFRRLTELGSDSRYEQLQKRAEFFALLQIKRPQLSYAEENTFSFVNSAPDFEHVVPKKFGFCGGMTEVLRDVSYMAFFDPDNRSGQTIPDRVQDPEAFAEFYLEKFRQMSRARPQVLPGFADLHSLSSDPLLEPQLKLLVAKRWAEEAAKPSGMAILRRARKPMKDKSREAVLSRLETRVNRGELPKLMFSAFALRPVGGKRIHVVSIWKVERRDDGSRRLYTWETNFHVRDVISAPPHIEVRPDGSMFYKPWYDDHVRASNESGKPLDPQAGLVAQLYMPKETERDTAAYWRGLKDFCGAAETASYCAVAPGVMESAKDSIIEEGPVSDDLEENEGI